MQNYIKYISVNVTENNFAESIFFISNI